VVPNGGREVVLAVLDFLEQKHGIFVVEGREAAEQDIEDDTDRPVIALLSIGLLEKDLRCDIPWRSAGCRGQGLKGDKTRETEVGDLNNTGGGIFSRVQQIFGLNISVDDVQGVAVNDSINNGSDGVRGLFFCVHFFLENDVEKFSSSHQLHYQGVVL